MVPWLTILRRGRGWKTPQAKVRLQAFVPLRQFFVRILDESREFGLNERVSIRAELFPTIGVGAKSGKLVAEIVDDPTAIRVAREKSEAK